MTSHDLDLVSFTADLSVPPRLLAIGEPMHGSEEILRTRNDVVEDLILRGGYRSIAVESDLHRGPLVNDYIAGADVDPERVLTEGFSHPYVHRLDAARELLDRLREINAELPTPVRFYGFDGPMEMAAAPSPREYVLRLHAAVVAADGGAPVHTAEIEELAGADARWTDESAMYHAERSVGRTPEADRLRLLADDLCAAADACGPALAPSGESRFRVAADARTAVGLLRYHAIMATDTPDRLGRLSAQRDAMMGANLLAIAEREAGRGPTVVFAHNLHLQREPSEMRMGPHRVRWFSAGAQAAARLGGAYRFVPMAIGAAPAHGLGAPAPGTVEGELYRHQTAAARLYRAADLAGPAECATERTDRDARGAYFPLAPEHLADADGVLFLREVRA